MTKAIAPTVVTYPHIEGPVTLLPGDLMRGVQIEVNKAWAKALRAADGRVFINGPDFENIGMIGKLIENDDTEIIAGSTLLTSIYIEGRARLVDLEEKGGVDYARIEPLELSADVDFGVIETALDRMHETLAGHLSDNALAVAMMQLEDTATMDPQLLAGTLMGILYGAQLIEDDREDNKKLLEAADLAEQLALIEGVLKKAEAEKQRLLAVSKEVAVRDVKPTAMQATAKPEDEFAKMAREIAEAGMPEEVRIKCEEKLKELRETNPPMGQSFAKGKKWLKTMISVPWNKSTEPVESLEHARQILDEDHYGMDEPKEEIIEHLGVQFRSGGEGGAILALAGPPGVGKTSLGKSVARALNRKFARISLGGVSSESAIRGYDDNYVSAGPGQIVKAMIKEGSNNLVILLDELDKLGESREHGDPSAALLEVLDPAQNHTFHDNYLDVDLDLSNIMFLATANYIEKIPPALLDRLNLIVIDGYTEEEKLQIAKQHLLKNQFNKTRISPEKITITDETIKTLNEDYTLEEGVRNLEKKIGKIMRKAAIQIDKTGEAVVINPEDLEEYIGKKRVEREQVDPAPVVGHVNGLAVMGGAYGEVLPIEAIMFDDDGAETASGNVQDTMSQSIQNALAFVKKNAAELGITPETYKKNKLHIMAGTGGIPKDGPSAGLAFATLFASVWSNTPIRGDVAMTGEIGVLGQSRIIGGLDKKLDGAFKQGVKTAIIPVANMKDFDEKTFPQSLKDKLEIMDDANFDPDTSVPEGKMRVIPVKNAMEVFHHALEYMPVPIPAQKHEQSASLEGVDPQALGHLLKLAQAFSHVSQPAAVNDDVKPVRVAKARKTASSTPKR